MGWFKKKPKKYKVVEFYCPEYDRMMYYIQEKSLFGWYPVDYDFYDRVHKYKKVAIYGRTTLYYTKEDAVDIVRENVLLVERMNRKDNPPTKSTEFSAEDFKENEG